MLVADKIIRERKKKGMSTAQLAEVVGVSDTTISRYERGIIQVISTDVLRNIADALDCDFDEFVSEDPRYAYLSSKGLHVEFDEDDKQLVLWFHSLPAEMQSYIKRLWKLPL